jgi:FAS-associated factor 2
LDTVKFIDEFNLQYSLNHPTFHPSSYQSAVSLAFSSSRFLLVYLHSPMHEDSDRFCRQVLCSQTLRDLASQQMVTWVGKVWDPEAYGLSTQLRASSFPFVALLVCQSNRVVQIAERLQGCTDERALVEKLRGAMDQFNTVLSASRAEAARRDEASRLRQEQDREYLESAEEDRRMEERARLERIEREEREEAARQAQELAEAVEMSRQLTEADNLRKRREAVLANPEPPVSSEVSTVRFQLPRGTKVTRRFNKFDKAQVIFI